MSVSCGYHFVNCIGMDVIWKRNNVVFLFDLPSTIYSSPHPLRLFLVVFLVTILCLFIFYLSCSIIWNFTLLFSLLIFLRLILLGIIIFPSSSFLLSFCFSTTSIIFLCFCFFFWFFSLKFHSFYRVYFLFPSIIFSFFCLSISYTFFCLQIFAICVSCSFWFCESLKSFFSSAGQLRHLFSN